MIVLIVLFGYPFDDHFRASCSRAKTMRTSSSDDEEYDEEPSVVEHDEKELACSRIN